MGDNRENSKDSRHVGPIKEKFFREAADEYKKRLLKRKFGQPLLIFLHSG